VPRDIAAEIRKYALPLIPIAVLNWTTSVSDRYIIQWLSHDLVSVGVYSAGYGLISQPILISNAVIALTLRPVYFSAVSRNDVEHARRTFRTWLYLSSGLCLAAVAVIFAGKRVVVSLFLGAKYQGAVQVVPWVALGYFFYVSDQVLEQYLLAHKKTRFVLFAQVCGGLASVAVTIPLVFTYGMVGAAYACPVYFAIQCAVAGILVIRETSRELPSTMY
jgi:O-antigen/teichoic acid export membrane protein